MENVFPRRAQIVNVETDKYRTVGGGEQIELARVTTTEPREGVMFKQRQEWAGANRQSWGRAVQAVESHVQVS